ncbi:MAG: DNA polymerase III subunit beta [Clostridia bacterium]|nr:DNA polymerase III subunit beta [Clostridia bacterium]
MQFVCTRSDLNEAVSAVQHAIGKVQNTIQDCILIECRDNRVVLRATDSTLSIRTELDAIVNNDGRAAVPARLLGEIVRRLPDADVTVTTSGQSALYLQCLSAKVDLRMQNADEFPVPPQVEETAPVSLPQAQLRRMIEQVVFAVAVNEDKPILTGVLFQLEKDRLTLVALDGFRMAVRSDTILSDMEGSFVIPSRALREAVRAMQDTEEEMSIRFDASRACFSVGTTEITTQLLEGRYVRYDSLFPKSFAIRVRADRLMLLEALQRASVIASGEENNVVMFDIHDNDLSLEAASQAGQLSESLPAITQGDDLRIALNGRFVMDVLKAIEDEEVEMVFNTSTSPCAFERHGIQSYGYLILPIQVNR